MVSQAEEGEVGERLEVGGQRGTVRLLFYVYVVWIEISSHQVRWVGEVDGTEGEWLGLEWDREGRGKHDGTHKGTTYFQPVRSAKVFCYLLAKIWNFMKLVSGLAIFAHFCGGQR